MTRRSGRRRRTRAAGTVRTWCRATSRWSATSPDTIPTSTPPSSPRTACTTTPSPPARRARSTGGATRAATRPPTQASPASAVGLTWSAAQQTSCTSCMKDARLLVRRLLRRLDGPELREDRRLPGARAGHVHQGRDGRRARRQQRQHRALPRTERLVQRELPQLLPAEVRGGTEGPEGRARGASASSGSGSHAERRRRRAPARERSTPTCDMFGSPSAWDANRTADHERDQQYEQGQLHERARAARGGAARRRAAVLHEDRTRGSPRRSPTATSRTTRRQERAGPSATSARRPRCS